MRPAILTDVTKCIGCEKCVAACMDVNNLGQYKPGGVPNRQDIGDGLSAQRWTSIISQPEQHFARKQCRHCLEPACVSACPVGAMQKTPEGPVIYDKAICMGCRYCMVACPFGIPRYEWESAVPYVNKCTLCYARLQEGKLPGCVEACPTQATIFGDREVLLAEAANRLKAEPKKYVQHIYGEHEVGGTSVLYISDINLDFLNNYKTPLPKESLPDRTWGVMQAVPPVAVGMTLLSSGVYWIIERRMRMARLRIEEARQRRTEKGKQGQEGAEGQ
jgi:formate dehydrogenase iron-sulfur subunit